MTPAKSASLLRPKQIAVSVAACFALHAAQLQANPTGPTVVHGGVGFSGLGTSALSITNQAGGNAVINWNGFSIGVNELTKFQQFANLAVLNRVTGNELSSILGALQSDGRVFLINPNGIVFGASARIDTAGLVASSLGLSDQDFLASRLRFTEVPGAGAVVNNGVIQTTAGGRVYLVAPTVENNGLIQSPQGAIVLAAGREVELVDANSPYLTVKVAAASDSAVNVGNLVADSGRIGMFGALVRNAGTVAANGAVAGPGGEIRLVASKDLTLEAGSLVAANGTSGGSVLLQAEGGTNIVAGTVEAKGSAGAGGEVNALGVRVGVVGHGVIDASGDTGGGTVLVGGDYQGKNAAVQNAERTYIGSDGVIRADAGTTGDGGRVIVWADGDTGFFGSISARGGSQSGNGGFVETSGKQALQAFGQVNAGAPNGQGGTWLLDPADININPGSPPDDGGIEIDGQLLFAEATGEPTVVGASSIEAAFAYGNTSVLLQATNDISFNGNLSIANAGDLALQAGNDIKFNLYSLSLNGNLSLEAAAAGGAAPTTGAITSVPGGGNITTNGGSLNATGNSVGLGSIDTVGGAYGGGSVNVTANVGSIGTGAITTGGGFVGLNANNGSVTVAGAINTSNLGSGFGRTNGGVYVSAYGDITTQSITTRSLHPANGNGGDVTLVANTGVITVNGNIDTRGANGIDEGLFNSQYYGGTSAGWVALGRSALDGFTGNAITVNGSILASGGNGLTSFSVFVSPDLSGGDGGFVSFGGNCDGPCIFGPANGNIVVTGVISTSGGNGGTSLDNPNASTGGGQGGGVSVMTSGNIGIGAINARGGNAGNGADGGVYGNDGGWGGNLSLISDAGSAAIGSIDTSGGSGGNAGGTVTSSYSIGGWGGTGGYTEIRGATGVSVGSIVSRGANGGAAGNAGGYLYAYGGDGGEGGTVNAYSTSGPVSIGTIDFSGANGGGGGVASEYAWGGQGGRGGYLNASGTAVSIASIAGRGGNGAAGGTATGGSFPYAYGGYGGQGSSIYLSATGSVSIGPVDISGGHAGAGGTADQYAWGGGGGYAGYLDVNADSIGVGSITGRGGDGANGGSGIYANGGTGGGGASIYLNAAGVVATGAMDLLGGRGGNGGAAVLYGYGGGGYYGGSVSITGSSIATGAILASGGDGGAGGSISNGDGDSSGGWGGGGGSVRLDTSSTQSRSQVLLQDQLLVQKSALVTVSPTFGLSAGPIATGLINVSGGNGGSSGAIGSSFSTGGSGGSGGDAVLVGSTINVAGPILAVGGNGGGAVNASLPPSGSPGTPAGGDGGSGGEVWVYGLDAVRVNVGGTLGALAIDVSGGAGGSGNPATSPAGNGGNGGSGGSANVVGTPDMTLFGSIDASGGTGGAGGAGNGTFQGGNGGAGGNAGFIYLDASSTTASATGDGIIFVLAGTQFNVQGGAGGAGGAGGGTGGAAGSTNTFISMSDYFGTIVVLDPLSLSEVNSAFQQVLNGSDDSTIFVGGEDDKDEDEEKSKKEFGSCKG